MCAMEKKQLELKLSDYAFFCRSQLRSNVKCDPSLCYCFGPRLAWLQCGSVGCVVHARSLCSKSLRVVGRESLWAWPLALQTCMWMGMQGDFVVEELTCSEFQACERYLEPAVVSLSMEFRTTTVFITKVTFHLTLSLSAVLSLLSPNQYSCIRQP